MKVSFLKNKFITDNTKEIDENTLFLATKINEKYITPTIPNILYPKDIKDYFKINKIKLIGITGTNGKTTTASLIYSLLLDLGYKTALIGTRGFYINDKRVNSYTYTTPFTLELYSHIKNAVEAKCKFLVMEVSSHSIVQERIEGLDFFIKIHTNITRDHLDYHKTLQNYILAKHMFLTREGGTLLANIDDPNLQTDILGDFNSYSITKKDSDYKIDVYSLDGYLSGVIVSKNKSCTFDSNLVGYFNLYNILASVSAVKIATNKKLSKIVKALPNFGGVRGRMEVVSSSPLIVVDFAHTPDAMINVFKAFSKDIIVVFGAGGDRDKLKRPLMGEAASKYAKKLVLTDDNPRNENEKSIIDDILKGVEPSCEYEVITNRYQAIKRAIDIRKDDEMILVLGKGDEEYQIIKNEKHPFSDVNVIKDILGSSK